MDERLFICVIKEKPILYDYAKIINIMRQSSQARARTRARAHRSRLKNGRVKLDALFEWIDPRKTSGRSRGFFPTDPMAAVEQAPRRGPSIGP